MGSLSSSYLLLMLRWTSLLFPFSRLIGWCSSLDSNWCWCSNKCYLNYVHALFLHDRFWITTYLSDHHNHMPQNVGSLFYHLNQTNVYIDTYHPKKNCFAVSSLQVARLLSTKRTSKNEANFYCEPANTNQRSS